MQGRIRSTNLAWVEGEGKSCNNYHHHHTTATDEDKEKEKEEEDDDDIIIINNNNNLSTRAFWLHLLSFQAIYHSFRDTQAKAHNCSLHFTFLHRYPKLISNSIQIFLSTVENMDVH